MFRELRILKKNFENYMLLRKNNPGAWFPYNIQLKEVQYIKLGRHTHLGDGCKLYCWDSYNGEKLEHAPSISIGDCVSVTAELTIQCINSVRIDDYALLASNVCILDYNHCLSPENKSYLEGPLESSAGGVRLKEGCWICNNVIILPGVTIGKKSIIAAGSVVTHDVPDYTIAGGNPARILKRYDDQLKEWVRCEAG